MTQSKKTPPQPPLVPLPPPSGLRTTVEKGYFYWPSWRQLKGAVRWTRIAVTRSYDPYLRTIAIRRWKRLFRR